MNAIVPDALAAAFQRRPPDLHKYAAGVVAIIGGCAQYANAPVMAALGARAGGAGLVRLVASAESRIAAAALVPEATFSELGPGDAPPQADVTAAGMGLGTTKSAETLLNRILSGDAERIVLDADALTLLAKWRSAGKHVSSHATRTVVLTPHAGEAARLLGCTAAEIQAARPDAVRRIADAYHAVAVLKGHHTLVAAPGDTKVFECHAGNPFMALGGMGDLLAGVLSARWARLVKANPPTDPETAFAAACSAVWLHATASDALVKANPPEDPSVANTARKIASLRVELER